MNINKVIKGGVWFLGFTILAKVIALFNKIYLTRKLPLEEYGLFVSMFSLFGLILTFSSLGLNSSIVKFIPHYKVKQEYGKIKSVIVSILTFEFFMRLLIYIVLILITPWLMEHYFKVNYHTEFKLFSLIIIIELLYRNLKPFFKSFKNTIVLGIMEFLVPVFYMLFFIIFFKFNNTVYVPIISYLLTSIIIGIVFSIVALKTFNPFRYKVKDKRKIFNKMLGFGIPLVIANTGGVFLTYFDTIMLTSMTTLESVGIYNIAISSALLLSFIASALSVTLIPTVSELNANKNNKDIYSGLKKLYKYTLIFLIPTIIIGGILAKFLLRFFYGTEYGVGYIALRILLVGVVFVIFSGYNTRVLIGLGKPNLIAKTIWLSAIVNLILNIPLIHFYGYVGAAIATSVSYLCQMVLTNIQIKKTLGGVI